MCGTGPLRKSRCRGTSKIDRGTLTRSGKVPVPVVAVLWVGAGAFRVRKQKGKG